MGCGHCRLGDGLHPSPRLGQRYALSTVPTAPTTGWPCFGQTDGPVFDDQGSGEMSEVALFSVVKWPCFWLSKTPIYST